MGFRPIPRPCHSPQFSKEALSGGTPGFGDSLGSFDRIPHIQTGFAETMGLTQITTLFLDIGGVLLTNGWDRLMRKRAAETFLFDFEEMDERHLPKFDA